MAKADAAPKIVVIVQARLGSSRLPGKVLMQVAGRSLLAHCITRLQRAQLPSTIVLATTAGPEDDAVSEEARRLGIAVVRGSRDDVLDRYFQAASEHHADVVVRVTGDDPVVDPAEVDRLLTEFLDARSHECPLDYLTNQRGSERCIPLGLDVEVFSMEALTAAHQQTSAPGDREHVTPYLYRTGGQFRYLASHPAGWNYGDLRLTVDTPEDLQLIDQLLTRLGPDADSMSIFEHLRAHPELCQLNAGAAQRGTLSEQEQRSRQVQGKHLLLFADSGEQVGFGHVGRLEALADAWTELGGKATLVCGPLPPAFSSRIADAGIEHVHLELLEGTSSDFKHLAALAADRNSIAVAVDSYRHASADFRTAIPHLPLLWLDDLGSNALDADLILNSNPDFDRSIYGESGAQLLVGAEYVPLRAEFRHPWQQHERHGVLVTFGGADVANMTPAMTAKLDQTLPETTEILVLGEAPSDSSGFKHPRRITWLAHLPNMAETVSRASIAVGAAGSTTWQLASLGIPLVLLQTADNQAPVLRGALSRGLALSAGQVEASATREQRTAAAERATRLVRQLLSSPEQRAKLSQAGRRAIDGRGVWRIIDALMRTVTHRTATA